MSLISVMPRIRDPQMPPGSRVRCKSKRAFIRASSSSIPYLHRRSGEIPGRKSDTGEKERVSKGQRFYWGLGAVGEVMAMASADWLGKCPSPVRQVRWGGYSRGGGVVKVKDTEQDGVGWRRPALSVYLAFFQKENAGAPGWRSRLSVRLQPGHDLAVREIEPRVRLWADGSEPGACFRFCVSLSLCPSPVHALSLSVPKINKR